MSGLLIFLIEARSKGGFKAWADIIKENSSEKQTKIYWFSFIKVNKAVCVISCWLSSGKYVLAWFINITAKQSILISFPMTCFGEAVLKN